MMRCVVCGGENGSEVENGFLDGLLKMRNWANFIHQIGMYVHHLLPQLVTYLDLS
jgi:hypothetical protein